MLGCATIGGAEVVYHGSMPSITRFAPFAAVALALASVVGCHDYILGDGRSPPVSVALTHDTVAVGDSVGVILTVIDGANRVVSRPPYRLSVSDSTVARLHGNWLIGRRAGEAVVRAESGGDVGEASVVVR